MGIFDNRTLEFLSSKGQEKANRTILVREVRPIRTRYVEYVAIIMEFVGLGGRPLRDLVRQVRLDHQDLGLLRPLLQVRPGHRDRRSYRLAFQVAVGLAAG